MVDVTDRAALEQTFDATARHYGRIDVVFANAGIGGGPGFLKLDGERNPERALENLPNELWDRVIAIDLTAVFATLQAAARHMKRAGGRIIVTTSISAIRTETYVAAPYVAAKAGAAQLVRQAAPNWRATTSRSTPSRPGLSSPTFPAGGSRIRPYARHSRNSPRCTASADLPISRGWRCS